MHVRGVPMHEHKSALTSNKVISYRSYLKKLLRNIDCNYQLSVLCYYFNISFVSCSSSKFTYVKMKSTLNKFVLNLLVSQTDYSSLPQYVTSLKQAFNLPWDHVTRFPLQLPFPFHWSVESCSGDKSNPDTVDLNQSRQTFKTWLLLRNSLLTPPWTYSNDQTALL